MNNISGSKILKIVTKSFSLICIIYLKLYEIIIDYKQIVTPKIDI